MRDKLENMIKQFIKNYGETRYVKTKWKDPLITYADATDEMFYELKYIVSHSHAMPKDLLPDAKTVVAYFIPFDDTIVKSNVQGRECSKEWGQAYIETNKLILDLNTYIKDELNKLDHVAPYHQIPIALQFLMKYMLFFFRDLK